MDDYNHKELVLKLTIGRALRENKFHDISVDDVVLWAAKEAQGSNIIPPNIPTDRASLEKIFTYVTELLPNLNGGSKKYVRTMYNMFRQLITQPDYKLQLEKIDLDFGLKQAS